MDVPQFIAGRFRVECEIGSGGMGTVYRATHLGLHRPVAVKIIKPEYANDADVAERFLREARTMAKLRHANAAIIFDAGTLPDGRHFIVMEYIEGVTLSEALSREGRFSAERAVEIAIQICEALDEAHQLGIIHRDLKPANIMLKERGVCVLDFGVAKVLASADVTASNASTGSGQIIGTPRYMSPEQCLGQKVGARSDLYSLGVVLYEMLTGRPPFIDPLPSVVLVKQATAPPPPLPRLRQDLPRSLCLAVHTLLAKRSEDRPQTAAAAKSLLEKSLKQPVAEEPDIEPLPSALAATNAYRGLALRIGAPLVLVSILGALLLALGYAGPAAETAASVDKGLAEITKQSTASSVTSTANPKVKSENPPPTPASKPRPASFSLDQARDIVLSKTDDDINDVIIAQTVRGPAILAIEEDVRTGQTDFLMMERRGSTFRITDRGGLDTSTFRARRWEAEKVSVNDDARNQVLFYGINNYRNPTLKMILYDPEARKAYSLSIETDARTGQTRKSQWSDNAADSRVAAYRVLMRDKAKGILGRSPRGL